jgi:hypothetical protein
MGDRPTHHPQLLDYLASVFVENGWSIKQMHRLIMLSNTFIGSLPRFSGSSGRRSRQQNCSGDTIGTASKGKHFAIPCCS